MSCACAARKPAATPEVASLLRTADLHHGLAVGALRRSAYEDAEGQADPPAPGLGAGLACQLAVWVAEARARGLTRGEAGAVGSRRGRGVIATGNARRTARGGQA